MGRMRSVRLAIHGVYIPYKQARMAPGRAVGKVPDQARVILPGGGCVWHGGDAPIACRAAP